MNSSRELPQETYSGKSPSNLDDAPFEAGPRLPTRWLLLGLAGYVVARSVAYALSKPLWFDELLTLIVCRQSNIQGIVRALRLGVDGNPPFFYVVERTMAWLIPSEQIGYRLLSVLGFACTLILVYVFAKTRNGASAALVCASLLLVTPLFTFFAAEARPYSLLTACIAMALVCYQRSYAAPWVAGLFLSLLAAFSLHHYAVLSFLPFLMAELMTVYETNRVRPLVWLALLATPAPLLISWPVLMHSRQIWGVHFWAEPAALNAIPAAYGGFFRVESAWGTALSVGIFFMMLAPLFRKGSPPIVKGLSAVPPAERVLILGLILVPVFGYCAAKITHGPFVDRYFLASILGIVIAASALLRRAKPMELVFAAAFVLLAVGSQELGFWRSQLNRGTIDDRVKPLASLAKVAHHEDLPIVISDAGVYVELWHYSPPALGLRLAALADPTNSVIYTGTDTVDRIVLALRSCVPVAVHDFAPFGAEHRIFLLYSNGSRIDWWPARLAHDGNQVVLVAAEGPDAIYLVELKAPSPVTH